ncbi:MAG: CHASE2 domain-containing protein [Thermodesulfobacteriota bacterium]
MRFIDRYKGIGVGILAAILILILTYSGLFNDVLQRLEYWALDYRFRLTCRDLDSSEIIIVHVDDESIRKLGRWPWPRSYHARLIDILHQAGARVIGLDIILSTPDQQEDSQLIATIRKAQNVIIAAYPTLPTRMSFARDILTVENIQGPVKEMAESARGIGHIAVVYDNDSIVRRIPAALRARDKTLLAFGVEIALACGEPQPRKIEFGRESLQVNSIKIPLDSHGNMVVNYKGGTHTFTEIPYHRVLSGEIPADIFKDRIVLIGLTAAGLADAWSTPFVYEGKMSGVELNAHVIYTVLNREFFTHIDKRLSGIFILSLGIFAGYIFYRFPRQCTIFLLLAILTVFSASLYLFLKKRILLEVVPLVGVLVVTYVPLILIRSREDTAEIAKRDLEMSALYTTGELIKNAGNHSKEFPGFVCRLLKNLRGVDSCHVILHQERKKAVIDENGPDASERLVNQEIVQRVLQTGEAILQDNDPGTTGPGEGMYVPIKFGHTVYGVLFLKGKGQFTQRDRDFAAIFTDYLAFILEKSSMADKAQQSSLQAAQALLSLAETKYAYIREHSAEVSRLATKMAGILKMPENERKALHYAALLHDLGMTRIPEDIVYRSEPLTVDQRLYLESHPEMGLQVIGQMPFFDAAVPIIRHHHERYDGKGYPEGLAGDEIPLAAQILAVADSFVAMLTDRPYRKALGREEVLTEIKRQAGFQFSAEMVSTLLQALDKEDVHGE